MLKIGTVCSGIGSPEQAIKELNIQHENVFAVEKDKYAKQTYLANFQTQNMFDDMTKSDWLEHYVDLIVGGIPCQSFSLAGKRLGENDHRGLLFYDFYKYVKLRQPKYFIIENVKGLLSDAGGRTFQNWLDLLSQSVNTHYNMFPHEDSLLYNVHHTVLNSKDFGVPQNRERVFIVGIRNDLPNEFHFPIGFPLKNRLKDILEPIVDEKYYLSDKMVKGLFYTTSGKNGGFQKAEVKQEAIESSCLTSRMAKMGRSDNYVADTEKIGFINQDSQASAVYSAEGTAPTISAGTHGYALGYINEPNSQGITNTITSVQKDNLILIGQIPGYEQDGRIYSDDSLCPTLDTKCNKRPHIQIKEPITQNRIRRLTPLECFRLQSFPDSFIKPCSETQTYKQAGNTITVSVIKAILKNLIV